MGSAAGRCFDACCRAPRRPRKRPALLPGGAYLQQIAASGLPAACGTAPRCSPVEQICSRSLLQACFSAAPCRGSAPRCSPWSRSAAERCFRSASGRPAGRGSTRATPRWSRSAAQACFRAPRRLRRPPALLPGGADLQQIAASVLVQRALPAAEAPAQLPGGADLQQIAASGTTHRAGGWRERGAAGGGRGPNRTLFVAASRQAPRRAARAKRAPLDMFTRAERQCLTSP